MIRSTFFGFNTALSGLSSSQKWLDITGQNLTNLHTDGYTRQRLDVYSVASRTGSDLYSIGQRNAVGNGVYMNGVSQLRDPFLDVQFRLEAAELGVLDAKSSVLEDLSSTFDETTVDGLNAQIQDFIKQLQALSSQTGNKEFDAIAKSSAKALANLFNRYANQLETVRKQQESQLTDIDIKNVNNILVKIANVNSAIRDAQMSDNPALELRDERNLLLDELSTYMKINVQYTDTQLAPGVVVENCTVNFKGADGKPVQLIHNDMYSKIGTDSQVYYSNLNITNPDGTTTSSSYNLGFDQGDLKSINDMIDQMRTLTDSIKNETDVDKLAELKQQRTAVADKLALIDNITVTPNGDDYEVSLAIQTQTGAASVSLANTQTEKYASLDLTETQITTDTALLSDANVDTLNSLIKEISNLNQSLSDAQNAASPDATLIANLTNQRKNLLGKVEDLGLNITISNANSANPFDLEITLDGSDGSAGMTLLGDGFYNELHRSTINLDVDTPILSDKVTKGLNGYLSEVLTSYGNGNPARQTEYENSFKKTLADNLGLQPSDITITVLDADNLKVTVGTTVIDFTSDGTKKLQATDFVKNTSLADIDSGIFKGRLDMLNKSGEYDGGGETVRGIGYYEQALDTLVSTFAQLFNDANNPGKDPAITNPLFAAMGDPTGKITAGSITIADGWANGDYVITATKNENMGEPGTDNSGQSDNILKMIALFTDKVKFTTGSNETGSTLFTGTLQEFFSSIGNDLDIDLETTTSLVKNHVSVLGGIDDSRANLSGVSLDEEGVNILRFQKSYNAAARLMTTLDEAIDTIISKMGTVGR